MTVINREKIKDLYYADLLYSMHIAREKLKILKTSITKAFRNLRPMSKVAKKIFQNGMIIQNGKLLKSPL